MNYSLTVLFWLWLLFYVLFILISRCLINWAICLTCYLVVCWNRVGNESIYLSFPSHTCQHLNLLLRVWTINPTFWNKKFIKCPCSLHSFVANNLVREKSAALFTWYLLPSHFYLNNQSRVTVSGVTMHCNSPAPQTSPALMSVWEKITTNTCTTTVDWLCHVNKWRVQLVILASNFILSWSPPEKLL